MIHTEKDLKAFQSKVFNKDINLLEDKDFMSQILEMSKHKDQLIHLEQIALASLEDYLHLLPLTNYMVKNNFVKFDEQMIKVIAIVASKIVESFKANDINKEDVEPGYETIHLANNLFNKMTNIEYEDLKNYLKEVNINIDDIKDYYNIIISLDDIKEKSKDLLSVVLSENKKDYSLDQNVMEKVNYLLDKLNSSTTEINSIAYATMQFIVLKSIEDNYENLLPLAQHISNDNRFIIDDKVLSYIALNAYQIEIGLALMNEPLEKINNITKEFGFNEKLLLVNHRAENILNLARNLINNSSDEVYQSFYNSLDKFKIDKSKDSILIKVKSRNKMKI